MISVCVCATALIARSLIVLVLVLSLIWNCEQDVIFAADAVKLLRRTNRAQQRLRYSGFSFYLVQGGAKKEEQCLFLTAYSTAKEPVSILFPVGYMCLLVRGLPRER